MLRAFIDLCKASLVEVKAPFEVALISLWIWSVLVG